jgi:hypothetical protein
MLLQKKIRRTGTIEAEQPSVRSVLRRKFHDRIGGFRLVRREACERGIAPIREVDDSPRRLLGPSHVGGGFDDAQSIIVEKKRVLSKQVIEPRNKRVILGNDLSRELPERLLDLR